MFNPKVRIRCITIQVSDEEKSMIKSWAGPQSMSKKIRNLVLTTIGVIPVDNARTKSPNKFRYLDNMRNW